MMSFSYVDIADDPHGVMAWSQWRRYLGARRGGRHGSRDVEQAPCPQPSEIFSLLGQLFGDKAHLNSLTGEQKRSNEPDLTVFQEPCGRT
jgi:hypothetical protein